MQTHTMSGLETGAVGHGTQHLTKATSFAWCEHILNQYVLDTIVHLIINCFTSLVYTNLLCFIGSKNKKENNWINSYGIVKVESILSE